MPEPMKDAACAAIQDDINQYAITWGAPALRHAIAEKYRRCVNGMEVDPDREITVTLRGDRGMMATLLALLDPGDEVIIFEPFYENYGPDAMLAGGRAGLRAARFAPDWQFDPTRCGRRSRRRARGRSSSTRRTTPRGASSPARRSRASPSCGRARSAGLHRRALRVHRSTRAPPSDRDVAGDAGAHGHDLEAVEDVQLHRLADRLRDRAAGRTDAIRKVHDFLTVGAPAPLQAAGAVGFAFDAEYYNHVAELSGAARPAVDGADRAGFTFTVPEGAYYILADFSTLSGAKMVGDMEFARGWRGRSGWRRCRVELLRRTRALGRDARDSLRLLQEAGDARRCGGAVGTVG